MVIFRKQGDCPPSQVLLSYQLGTAAVEDAKRISSHLRECDFCSAEIDFYEHYPQSEDTAEPGPIPESSIPEPLLELAESLLNRKAGSKSIESILHEIETPSE